MPSLAALLRAKVLYLKDLSGAFSTRLLRMIG